MKTYIVSVGGRQNLQRKLAGGIRNKRRIKNFSQEQLDQECGFDGIKLPLTSEFEKDPRHLTEETVSRACLLLEIDLRDHVPVDAFLEDPKNMELVLEEMNSTNSGLIGSSGNGNLADVTQEEQAPVYLLFRIMEELAA